MPKLKDPEIQNKITQRVVTTIERLIELGMVRHQKEFCSTSGYKEANLSKIMNGERQAPLMLVYHRAFAYNVSPL
ncbi:MAG: hypothetical protein PHD21_05890, partial [Flavobacteriales bacterium]|nr:hypothetical protein [Flavobacteriales bacterium]